MAEQPPVSRARPGAVPRAAAPAARGCARPARDLRRGSSSRPSAVASARAHEAARRRRRRRRRRSRSGSSSRRASRAPRWRSGSRGREDRRREAPRPRRLSRAPYLAATRDGASCPCFGTRRRTNLEGFLFPATYDFLAHTRRAQLVTDQLDGVLPNWRSVDLRYARSKNLTPYDVLKIASMVEKETLAPAERRLVAAVIYNRLHARMPLGIDATLRYGLHIPPTQSILESQLQSDTRTTPATLRPAADPDRESRARIDPRRRASGEGRLPLLRPQAGQGAPLLHGERRPRSTQYACAHGYGCYGRRLVALLGHPVAHSLSPRMQNAAFAARGLDWHYAAFDVEDVGAAVARSATLGFAGANVTIPHKQAVVAACDEADGEASTRSSSATAACSASTPTGDPRPASTRRRACVIGAGGAARTLAPRAAAATRVFTRARRLAARRGRLRPDRERDAGARRGARRAASRARRSSTSRTGTGETALVAAARAAGCEVVDGREALVRQGAASFALLDGRAARPST